MIRFVSHVAAACAGAFAMLAIFSFALGFDPKGWQAVGLCAVSLAFMAATMPRSAK